MEIDGRLVPATDEEVMEVEELIMDDKNENHILKDTGKDAECTSKRESSSGMLPLKDPEGLSLFSLSYETKGHNFRACLVFFIINNSTWRTDAMFNMKMGPFKPFSLPYLLACHLLNLGS